MILKNNKKKYKISNPKRIEANINIYSSVELKHEEIFKGERQRYDRHRRKFVSKNKRKIIS